MTRKGIGDLVALVTLSLPIGVAGTVAGQPPALRETVRPAFDGEYRTVLADLLPRLESIPEDPVLNYYAGMCYYFLEESATAEFHLGRAVKNRAPFPETYYWLGRFLAEEKRWPEAREVLNAGLAHFPANEKLLLLDARFPAGEPSAATEH